MLRKNEPVRVVGVTTEGKKVYDGDTIPQFPNRKARRSYRRFNKNTNNASFNKKRNNRNVHPIFNKIFIGTLKLLQVIGIKNKYINK